MIELTISESNRSKVSITLTDDFGFQRSLTLGIKEKAMVERWFDQAAWMVANEVDGAYHEPR
jgi:hypothetical protein